jgi:hypothetical protein
VIERLLLLFVIGLVAGPARYLLAAGVLVVLLVDVALRSGLPRWAAWVEFRRRLVTAEAAVVRPRERRDTWRARALARSVDADRAGADGDTFADRYRQGLVGAKRKAGRPLWLTERFQPFEETEVGRWFAWYEWLLEQELGVVDAARIASHRVFRLDPAIEARAQAA